MSSKNKTTTAAEYDLATKNLTTENLGKVVSVKVAHASTTTSVFVKREPNNVTADSLKAATRNTVTLDTYSNRFKAEVDAHAITKGIKRKLTEENHVQPDTFKDLE